MSELDARRMSNLVQHPSIVMLNQGPVQEAWSQLPDPGRTRRHVFHDGQHRHPGLPPLPPLPLPLSWREDRPGIHPARLTGHRGRPRALPARPCGRRAGPRRHRVPRLGRAHPWRCRGQGHVPRPGPGGDRARAVDHVREDRKPCRGRVLDVHHPAALWRCAYHCSSLSCAAPMHIDR